MDTATLRTRDFNDRQRGTPPDEGQQGLRRHPRTAGRAPQSRPPTELRALPEEPAALWRDRRIQWVSGTLDAILKSVPELESTPLLNNLGIAHRQSSQIACLWPENGGLWTPERAAWSGTATGVGPAWPPPVQPANAIKAFAKLMECLRNHAPTWNLGITDDGEWYCLRAGLKPITGEERGDRSTEPFLVMYHGTYENDIRIDGGIRDTATGASIGFCPIRTKVEGRNLSDPAGIQTNRVHQDRLRENARAVEAMMTNWNMATIERKALKGWLDVYVTPMWGERATEETLDTPKETITASDVAWRLAEANARISNIEERARLGEHIVTVTDELARTLSGHAYREGAPVTHELMNNTIH